MISLLLATGDEGAGAMLLALFFIIAIFVGALSRSRIIVLLCAGYVGIIGLLCLRVYIHLDWEPVNGIIGVIAIAIALALFFFKVKGRTQ